MYLFHESESLCVFSFSFFIEYRFFSHTAHLNLDFPSSTPHNTLSPLLSSATPPQPLYIFFREENIIQRCQPNKTKNDTIRQGKSHPIKTGKEIQYNFLSVRMKAVWLRNIWLDIHKNKLSPVSWDYKNYFILWSRRDTKFPGILSLNNENNY